jgi:hypothetical protein
MVLQSLVYVNFNETLARPSIPHHREHPGVDTGWLVACITITGKDFRKKSWKSLKELA